MDGILNLDKPAGISSARAVSRIKRLLPRGIKVGHAGTLDPFATGVLLVLVGRATKGCEQLMDQPKQYETKILLGATTATDDPESIQIPWPRRREHVIPTSSDELKNTLLRFQGQIWQQPPAFSAIHVKGRRAYELARRGEPPVLPPRPVVIYSIEIVEYIWPELTLRVDCGRGTYIRALGRDIGAALDVGGHLTQLRRTRVGDYRIESAKNLDEISTENLAGFLRPF